MTSPLPLYPGARMCVGSGFCCKKTVCAFGERIDAKNPSCKHLKEIEQENGKHPRYTCGIYDYIVSQTGWEFNPAFGAGCCMPLFNADREAIIRDIKDGDNPTVDVAKHHRRDSVK
jgi:hypothetical protein